MTYFFRNGSSLEAEPNEFTFWIEQSPIQFFAGNVPNPSTLNPCCLRSIPFVTWYSRPTVGPILNGLLVEDHLVKYKGR